MVRIWNSHRIRPSKNQNCPSGRPFLLYTLPSIHNTHTYIQPVEEDYINVCREECTFRSKFPCDKDIFNLCLIYMEENDWLPPSDIDEAAVLYQQLREKCLAEL